MIQIYSGDGKGKTTAAVGISVRAAAYDIPVIFAQFLKDDSSGEIMLLKELKGLEIMHSPTFFGFVRNMTEEQKKELTKSYSDFMNQIFEQIEKYVNSNADADIRNSQLDESTEAVDENKVIVVFDEILHAINYNFVDEKKLIDFMSKYKANVEFILTGRNPSEELIELSDYYTDFKKVKHVYDSGIVARKGIEY